MSFWIKDPTILFNQKYITQLWPYPDLSYEEKLNAITRFVILITILGHKKPKTMKNLNGDVLRSNFSLETWDNKAASLSGYALAIDFVTHGVHASTTGTDEHDTSLLNHIHERRIFG